MESCPSETGTDVNTERPFHIMNAVDRTSAKFRTCARVWRVLDRFDDKNDNIVTVVYGLRDG